MDPRYLPRINGPKIHKIKLEVKYDKNKAYDSYNPELCNNIQSHLELYSESLRNGDIAIETDIENTLVFKDVIRLGMFIFNGKTFQYLDRSLNKSGSIPCNFVSCNMFKLGYWDSIFKDNLVWIKPNQSFNISNNFFITNSYTIYVDNEQIDFFRQLMNSSFSILVFKDDKNNLAFNRYLFDIYHTNMINDPTNEYSKILFQNTEHNNKDKLIYKIGIWSCTYNDMYTFFDRKIEERPKIQPKLHSKTISPKTSLKNELNKMKSEKK